jgi:hypothetical protein
MLADQPIPSYSIRINEIQRRMLLQSCCARAQQLMSGAETIQPHEAEVLLMLIRCLNNDNSGLSVTGLNSFVL